MSDLSILNLSASCPACNFTTEEAVGTCPDCGGKLLLAEERLDAENQFDTAKIFSVSSALFLLMIFLTENPWPMRHMNDFAGLWSSVLIMGPIAGILTGIILMFLRSSNRALPLLILVVIGPVLVALDRLILTNFF